MEIVFWYSLVVGTIFIIWFVAVVIAYNKNFREKM